MINIKYIRFVFVLCGLCVIGCNQASFDVELADDFFQHQLIEWNDQLTDVIVADIFTPPVCSRIYAYPHIAAYEVFANTTNDVASLSGELRDLKPSALPQNNDLIYPPLSSIIAFSTVGKALVYSGDLVEKAENEFLSAIDYFNISDQMKNESIEYGRQIGKHILDWAAKDGYLERTAMMQYVLSDEPGSWKPTPPDYMPAIEPHWNTLRPFMLQSAKQFSPNAPTNYSKKESSSFFDGAKEVYEVVNNLNAERTEIAKFWDCNPNVSRTKGHLTFFDQKISPGGHWMSIAGIACHKKNTSFAETSKVLTLSAITMADAFISCWDEKYRSSLIRPETYINEFIDPDWKPVLQTPAFPEHTSGHSVVSAAGSEMLTFLLGDHFSFIDSTEVKYGLPVRSFDSFFAARDEAAISRLYGGIHYRPAIDDGVAQGTEVGKYMVKMLNEYK